MKNLLKVLMEMLDSVHALKELNTIPGDDQQKSRKSLLLIQSPWRSVELWVLYISLKSYKLDKKARRNK